MPPNILYSAIKLILTKFSSKVSFKAETLLIKSTIMTIIKNQIAYVLCELSKLQKLINESTSTSMKLRILSMH